MGKKMKDYDEFVEKFKPKKTTDDCYTPPLLSVKHAPAVTSLGTAYFCPKS